MPGTPTSCANRSLPPASTATDGRGVGHELRTSRSLRRPIAPRPVLLRCPSLEHAHALTALRRAEDAAAAAQSIIGNSLPEEDPAATAAARAAGGQLQTGLATPWALGAGSLPMGDCGWRDRPPIGDHGSRQCPLEARASPPIWTGPRAALSSAAIDREWMICVQLEDPAGHIAPGATGYQFPRRRQGPTRLCAWG